MPSKAQHKGLEATWIHTPERMHVAAYLRSNKRDTVIVLALSKLVTIQESKEIEVINRIKRQLLESENYSQLQNEYLKLHEKVNDTNLPPFLASMTRNCMLRIKKQINALVDRSEIQIPLSHHEIHSSLINL